MNHAKYPNLGLLLAAYLHQDWDLEFESVESAVRAFASKESKGVVAKAREEIDSVLQLRCKEQDLVKLLTEQLGSSYNPRLSGISPQVWLQSIQALL